MDGFMKKEEIQPILQKEIQYSEEVANSVRLITTTYSFTPKPCPSIEGFLLYKNMNMEGVVATYKSNAVHPPLCLYQVCYTSSYETKYISHNCPQSFLALIPLQRTFPRTCILEETLQTRINDWFVKQDVDFEEQKKFSKLFHVVSNDKTKLEYLLKDRPLDQLADFPDMQAEMYGNACLLKLSSALASENQVKATLELAKKAYQLFC